MKLGNLFEYYEHLLLEGQYDKMFHKDYDKLRDIFVFKGRTPQTESVWKNNIMFGKVSLKKQDRIVWFLRWAKAHHLTKLYTHIEHANLATWITYLDERGLKTDEDTVKSEKNKLLQRINKDLKKIKSTKPVDVKTVDRYILELNVMIDDLDHFLSLDIYKINNHTFTNETPNDIRDLFLGYEEEWKENRKRNILHTGDETVFVQVSPDLAWFDLESPSCQAEGQAMGHCGNSPARHDSNQTILSLRERTEDEWWKPHATFIYHKRDKALGEMKGVYNKKPKPETHKAIFKLIMDKRIQELKGGGYLAENNFTPSDLPDAMFDKIVKSKPTLISIVVYYEKFGFKKTIAAYGKEKFVTTSWERQFIGRDQYSNTGWGVYFKEVGYKQFIKDFSKDEFAKHVGLRGYYEKEGMDKTIKEFGKENFAENVDDGYDIYFNEYGLDKFIKDFSRDILIDQVGLNYYISEKGFDAFIIKELKEMDIKFLDNDKTIVVTEHPNIEDFVDDYGDDATKGVFSMLSGEDHIDLTWSDINSETIDYHITKEQESILKSYAAKKYPDDYEESDEDWYATLDINADEILDEDGIKQAYYDAEYLGTEKAMSDDFNSTYAYGMKGGRGEQVFDMLPEKVVWDKPIMVTVETKYVESEAKDVGHYSIEALADYITSALEEEPTFNIGDHHYGWNGFDEEHFKETVDAILKDIKK